MVSTTSVQEARLAPALLPVGALLSYPWALLLSVETLTGYTALIQNPGMLKGGAHLINVFTVAAGEEGRADVLLYS